MHDRPINKSYPLPLETMPGLDLSHHVEDLVEVQEFLERRGIHTRSTRIQRYIDYLRQVTLEKSADPGMIFKNSAEGPFTHPTDWMLYVLREAHELMWILKGLKVHVPVGTDDKMKVIVGGRDFAALDADSQSRNTQFELRIASYFCQAGCDVDLSTETDIIAVSDSEAFYLECKRVGSRNQLQRRLSDAKAQLHRRVPKKHGQRTVCGCVPADVTKVAFSHNGLTFAVTNQHSRDVIQEKLIAIANDSQRLPLFQDCHNLLNYWFQIHISALILQPPTTATRFSSYHIFNDKMSRKERRAIKAFCCLFESASQGDPRDVPPQPLTPRATFTFPQGTILSLDEALLAEYLERGEVAERGMNEEIATLTINNKKYVFSFFDFTMALPRLKETRGSMKGDPDRARLEVVMCMYAQRFPYEESGGDLGTA